MEKLARIWRGELALGDVFWNWAVIGGLAVNITTSLAFFVLISSSQGIAAPYPCQLFHPGLNSTRWPSRHGPQPSGVPRR